MKYGDGTKKQDSFSKIDSNTKCPPVKPCNWCNGIALKDGYGCTIGFRCANGADPCYVYPCTSTPNVCKLTEKCGTDGLCWPKTDGGVVNSYPCGTLTHCIVGEACRDDADGTCVELPPNNVCPANCSTAICPGGKNGCLCHSYSCTALPTGCTSCSCATWPGICSCSDNGMGKVLVTCSGP
jgi:hypothetical protein